MCVLELFNAENQRIQIFTNDSHVTGISHAYARDISGNIIYINYFDKVKQYCFNHGYIY